MSLNKVLLIGNVGREPEIHYVKDGVCTASLSLATSTPGYTLSSGTQVPERTEWHRVLLWRRMAEITEKYVHKGDKLYIEGRIRYRSYDDKKGMRRYVTEIYGDNLEWLSASRKNENISEGKVDDSADDTSDDTKLPF